MAKLLKPSHLVSFRLIPLVDRGWGFTLILAFSPQGRRDLQGAGTGTRVGGATAGTGLSRWDGDRLRWCTLATPGIGPGRSRPRHACRNLGGRGSVACVSGLHAPRDGTGVLLQHWNHRNRSVACMQLVIVALMSFTVRSVRVGGWGRGRGRDAKFPPSRRTTTGVRTAASAGLLPLPACQQRPWELH